VCDLEDYLRNATGAKQGPCSARHVPNIGWGFKAVVCRKHYDIASRDERLLHLPSSHRLPEERLGAGAGDRDRTGDIQLGKLAFYH
jgi:hypothetical protein